jgi:hypothetical protein
MVGASSAAPDHAADAPESQAAGTAGLHWRAAVKPPLTFATHSWLPAVVPADATRFRVPDPDLAYTLAHAGARLVDDDPEVEIAPLELLEGRSPVAIVPIDARSAAPSGRARQASDRIAMSMAARVRAAAARRLLRRRGYPHVAGIPWDRDQVIRVPGLAAPHALSLAERFPRRILLVARRGPAAPTALDRALADAAREAGTRLDPSWPLPRAGGLVVLMDAGVLRAALGPGDNRILAQNAALAALAAAAPPPAIRKRAPVIVAEGRSGLARWSLEQRLPGRPAPHAVDRSLLDECVDFAIGLHELGDPGAAGTSSDQAETVGEFLSAEKAEGLRALARRLDRDLSGLPRGFGHGDFCTSNLLVAGGRLAGVVDWEAAGRARLPLLDLIHLELLAATRAGVYEWGGAVRGHLFPGARGGVAPVAVDYFRGLGLSPSPRQVDALAAVYWLERVSDQLGSYFERRRDRVWIERNVEQVLDTLLTQL